METKTDIALSNVDLPVLDMSRPTVDQIFQSVKMAILRMDLPPDTLVSEKEIGQKVGASRTPVREAFTQLRQDGLIVTRPSRGNYVSRLSESRIREAQFIREGLELNNIRHLCEIGLAPDDLEDMQEILNQQAACITTGDDFGFQANDDRFHEALAAATGHLRASTLLKREKTVLDRLRILSLADAARKTDLLKQHRSILDAIATRNAQDAVYHMRVHLRAVLTDLASLIQANRSFFE